MGFVARAVSSIFGGGDDEATPTVVKTDPTPTSVSDASADTGKDTIAAKRKKKNDYRGDFTGAGSIASTATTDEEQKRTSLG